MALFDPPHPHARPYLPHEVDKLPDADRVRATIMSVEEDYLDLDEKVADLESNQAKAAMILSDALDLIEASGSTILPDALADLERRIADALSYIDVDDP